MRPKLPILAYIWFYVGWFACLWCAMHDASLWSLLVPVVSWLLLHQITPLRARFVLFMMGIFAMGLGFDIALVQAGLVEIIPQFQGYAPAWLVAMWLLYVSVLPLSTKFFESRLWLAIILGAIMGPLSYKYGVFAGVLKFNGSMVLFYYAAFWGLFFPVSVYTKRKLL